MMIEKFNLWENIPGTSQSVKPYITAYVPDNKKSDAAVVILPGGAYSFRSPHEGEGYAMFLAGNGVTAFVCDYRVAPDYFPCPLLDARRAICFVRHNADKYGLDINKIGIMGSSAGGHLAAMTSTYYAPVENANPDETDAEDFRPNFQILCYPVITTDMSFAHAGSIIALLGKQLENDELLDYYSLEKQVTADTPQAFIWHTACDSEVPVKNSLEYAKSLAAHKIPVELHIYPFAQHGLAFGKFKHTEKWVYDLECWLKDIILTDEAAQ